MGKRELLLIVAFAVIGLLVWRLTAPPTEPGARGFSLRQVIDSIRTGLQSHDTEADLRTSTTAEAPPAVTAVEADEFTGPVVVEGIDGERIVADLRGTVYGPDEATAQAYAAAVAVRTRVDGEKVRLEIERPEMRRSPRLELTLKIPRRLGAIIVMRGGRLEARHLAGLDFDVRRTTVLASDIGGLVKGNQNLGEVEIADVGTVNLNARRAEVRVERVSGRFEGKPDSGDWLLRDVTGPVTLDSERADLSLERLSGDLSFEASGGSITVRDEVGNVRGESHRCRLSFRVTGPGTIDVTSEDATVELQIDPKVGARYDLRAEEGKITGPEGSLRIDAAEAVTEASGTVGPGGRTVKVRSRRGDITVRP